MSRDVIVGVDVGGTFTDLFLLDAAAGSFRTAKVPSHRGDEAQGFLNGLQALVRIPSISADPERAVRAALARRTRGSIAARRVPAVAAAHATSFRRSGRAARDARAAQHLSRWRRGALTRIRPSGTGVSITVRELDN